MVDFEDILKNKHLHFSAVLVVFFIVFFWQYGLNFGEHSSFREEWYNCMKDISEGNLYNMEEGNLFCYQGPALFYFFYAVKIIAQEKFLLALGWIALLLNAISLFIIQKILKKETGKTRFFATTVLYAGLILPSTIQDDLSNKLAMFASLLAFYLLFYAEKPRVISG
ncbi:MAG: hypothetical protein AABW87_00125, partial [Nanoarchaeota archaeon]